MRVVNANFEIMSDTDGLEILKHIEKVGRTCYKSEDKISDSSCFDFVRGLIARGHEAVIEHYNITVKFIIDRGISHEVVRHRVASYAQESTRYCNYSKDKFNNQITYVDIKNGLNLDNSCNKLTEEQKNKIYDEWLQACLDAEEHYNKMIELGASAQIARSVLNNSTKTELCMTANLREWRHFFKLRTDKPAHPQMREIAIKLLKAFVEYIPVIFDDIYNEVDTDTIYKLGEYDYDDFETKYEQITIDDWLKEKNNE